MYLKLKNGVKNKMTTIKPPFTEETARAKVKAAQDAWNTLDPEVVVKGYSVDSKWRNRTEFFSGHDAMKQLWAFTGNRISVRFEYEWKDADTGQWMRTHGNEHWEFNEDGLMHTRDMSANDYSIDESERRIK